MAKLIIVLSQEADNYLQTDNYARWGLGDLIKGISSAYCLCEELGVQLEIVSCEHPISEFYNFTQALPADFPNGRHFKPFQNQNAMRSYISCLKAKDKEEAILTNGYGEWPNTISNACKGYIQSLLQLNETWQKKWDNLGIKSRNYSVLHIRMGDDHLINQLANIPLSIKLLLFFMSWKDLFLLTDSIAIRNYAKQRYSFKMTTYEPKHLGLHKRKQDIAGTIIEFNIMCSARNIYSYSYYDWVSSFAMVATKVYDVPIVNLKKLSLRYQLKMFARKIRWK